MIKTISYVAHQSMCANWRSRYPQPINIKKNNKSISRGCAPRGSHIT